MVSSSGAGRNLRLSWLDVTPVAGQLAASESIQFRMNIHSFNSKTKLQTNFEMGTFSNRSFWIVEEISTQKKITWDDWKPRILSGLVYYHAPFHGDLWYKSNWRVSLVQREHIVCRNYKEASNSKHHLQTLQTEFVATGLTTKHRHWTPQKKKRDN